MNLTSHFRFSTCFYTLLRPPGCHRTFGQPAALAIVHVCLSTHHTTHPLNGHHSPQPANVLRSLTPCRHTASDSSHRLTTDYTCHSSSAVVGFKASDLFGCPHSQGLGLGCFGTAALGQKVTDGVRLHKLEHISPEN